MGQTDTLYDEAAAWVAHVVTLDHVGPYVRPSMLQRKFGIGYTRAARLVDLMRENGIAGDWDGRGYPVTPTPEDRADSAGGVNET